MKSGNPETSSFKTGRLPKQIGDLPGVVNGQLSRHFPKGRGKGRSVEGVEKADALRSKVAEGLGLNKGRRFFKEED